MRIQYYNAYHTTVKQYKFIIHTITIRSMNLRKYNEYRYIMLSPNVNMEQLNSYINELDTLTPAVKRSYRRHLQFKVHRVGWQCK